MSHLQLQNIQQHKYLFQEFSVGNHYILLGQDQDLHYYPHYLLYLEYYHCHHQYLDYLLFHHHHCLEFLLDLLEKRLEHQEFRHYHHHYLSYYLLHHCQYPRGHGDYTLNISYRTIYLVNYNIKITYLGQ